MKLGADPKRTALLGGLVLVGGYLLWSNVFSSDSSSSAARTAAPVTTASPSEAIPSSASDNARLAARRNKLQRPSGSWNPSLSRDAIDPVKVDPTLRLDLLAKVQRVEVSGSQRNLFQFGEAAKAPGPVVPIPHVPKIPVGGVKPAPVITAGPPAAPTAPPITLKYYGYANSKASTRRRAFFLDGEDIIVASEGEVLKHRYLLVKIGVNSVTMQDTQFKTEQTLPLAEELAG